jgi:hypothetical protein
MLTHSASVQPDDPTFFEDSEVVDFRGHGAKPTLINSAIMQSIDRDSIREQGGWKSQNEDDMPHTYAREMMNKALLLQEKVLKHLRDGGDTVGAVLTSIVTKEPPKRGPFESDALAPADDERQSQRESRPEADESRAEKSPLAIRDEEFEYIEDSTLELEAAELPDHLSCTAGDKAVESPIPLDESENEAISEMSYDHHAEDAILLALLNENTGKYHLEGDGKKRAARCGRGKGELLTLHVDTFRSVVSSRALSSCCEVCFPAPSRASKILRCVHICGVNVGDAFCSNRCEKLHASEDSPREGEWTHRCSDHREVLDPFVGIPFEAEPEANSIFAGSEAVVPRACA